MKRYRSLVALAIFLLLCGGISWLVLHVTAQYPALGEPVSYPIDQGDGFALTMEEPSWSPFTGYTLRWNVEADSENTYVFIADASSPFEYLERQVDGQWYRLDCQRESDGLSELRFELGGDSDGTGLGGSVVQKYAGYGTRLETGIYRLALKMIAEDGTLHYLAAEFHVE